LDHPAIKYFENPVNDVVSKLANDVERSHSSTARDSRGYRACFSVSESTTIRRLSSSPGPVSRPRRSHPTIRAQSTLAIT
jgi:hypothetical protein